VPVPIPNPCFAGAPSAEYPCPFAGYPVIHGATLTGLNLPDALRKAMAKPLAEFLAALHSVPVDEARCRGLREDTLHRLDFDRRRLKTAQRLAALLKAGRITDRRPIDRLLETLPVIASPAATTVVHGDLHSSQILVNKDHELAGVIDWGDVHIGNPAIDLAVAHALLPKSAHDDFLGTYGPVEETTWAAAKGRALWHTIGVLAQASEVGNVSTMLEAQSCLARLVQD